MLNLQDFQNEFKTQLNNTNNTKRGISDLDLTKALALKYSNVTLNEIAGFLNSNYDLKFTKSTLSKFFKKIEEVYKNEEFLKNAVEVAKQVNNGSKPIEKAKKTRKPKVEKKAVAEKNDVNYWDTKLE